MKIIRKIAAVLLGTAILVTNATGCGKSNVNNDSGTDAEKKKLVFWDKSEYVSAYTKMMKEKVDEFAKKNDVDVDYVTVSANDLKSKLMAAIEANSVPDLIVGDDTLVGEFVSMDQIADCSDIFEAVDFTDNAKTLGVFNKKEYIVPLAFLASGIYLRTDKWEEAGLSAPKTWEELREQAEKVNDPKNGFYALGFAMGTSGGGDAEGFVRTVILDYGGIPVDENGKVTINSPETLEALKYIASLYADNLVPPDAITGDDSWNNNAYIAGTVGVIGNSGSVVSTLKDENQELLKNTEIIGWPAGPKGQYALGGANVFGVFETGKNTETAKAFVKYYFDDLDYYNQMIEAMGAMWQPVVKGMDDTDFWKKPENVGWIENAKMSVRSYYPAPADERAIPTYSNKLCVKAMQEIIVNGKDPQKALDDLEAGFKEIYK